MKPINILCRRRLVAVAAGTVCAVAAAVSAHDELNVERLDGRKVTRLTVSAADQSVMLGTVASGPLGPAVVYNADATGYITGCWDHSCAVGFADELRFANFPVGGGELSSYTFSYSAGYGYFFGYCIPGDPAGGRCDCYCPTGGECDEGDPPYTLDAALYDGPPGLCGGGLPVPGTEVEIVTTASRPLGDERIDVRVDLEPTVFVPGAVWGVVTLDIEDAWLVIGSAPEIGGSAFDGAMWIDSDSDGCMDEWECWPDPYGWTCPGCTGWSVWDAEANAEFVMRWQPVLPPASTKHSATSTYTIQGNEAILAAGGEPVWLEARVSDFDPKQTGTLVKAWQAGVDSSGYTSGLQGTLAGYLVQCTSPYGVPDAQCESQLGPDSWCNHPNGPYPDFCTPGWFRDADRTDYIFHDQMATGGQDYTEPNYRWGSTIFTDPIPSPGRESYLATMVLFVPPDAKGTFEIDFLPPPDCALVDGNNQFIPLLGFVPGKITVEVGACCIGLGVGDKKQGCIEDVTVNQCENFGLCKGYCQEDPRVRCMSDVECELEGVSGYCIGGDTLGQICSPFEKPLGKQIFCDAAGGDICVVQGQAVFSPGSVCTGGLCSDCNQNGLLDAIEIEDEPAYDCNRNGALDVCEKGATDPLLYVQKSRYLTIPTAGLTGDVAIRVTFDDLAAPADLFNGESMWVDLPFERSIHGHISEPVPGYPNYKTATLRCDPVFTSFGEAPVVEVHDEFIIPGSTYAVEVFDQHGPGGTPAPVGEPSVIVTSRWCDATARFDLATGIWTEPDGFVHVAMDIGALLESFKSWVCAPRKVRVDFSPALPDGEIDILDAVHALDAFMGVQYPFAPTESPCP